MPLSSPGRGQPKVGKLTSVLLSGSGPHYLDRGNLNHCISGSSQNPAGAQASSPPPSLADRRLPGAGSASRESSCSQASLWVRQSPNSSAGKEEPWLVVAPAGGMAYGWRRCGAQPGAGGAGPHVA